MSEAQEQKAVIAYCDEAGIPIFHIPNGGKRNPREASNLKAQGVRAGVPDLFVPIAANGRHGLFIEMKAAKGRVSDKQREWLGLLDSQGYRTAVCFGAGQAIDVLKGYLDG